jgi:photosystem II stability/assembly factor-like uncharacterized protein
MALAAVGSVGCKKGAGGGGGGGGGWLVGRSGLMANIQSDGTLGAGYDLGSTENLNAIACRGDDEAWVVGDNATLLYTDDAGDSWTAQSVPTNANLHALATQDAGPVFVAGDGAFLMSTDAGDHWAQLGATGINYTSVAAAQSGATVLALDTSGGVWSYTNGALAKVTTMTGAKAIAVSPDGQTAVVAGAGLQLSTNAGRTWLPLSVDAKLADVRVDDSANIVSVGELGTIVNVAWGANVTVQHVGTANLNTVHVRSWDGSTAVGYAAGAGGEVLVTHDVGATWTQGPNLGRDVMGVDEIGAGHR